LLYRSLHINNSFFKNKNIFIIFFGSKCEANFKKIGSNFSGHYIPTISAYPGAKQV